MKTQPCTSPLPRILLRVACGSLLLVGCGKPAPEAAPPPPAAPVAPALLEVPLPGEPTTATDLPVAVTPTRPAAEKDAFLAQTRTLLDEARRRLEANQPDEACIPLDALAANLKAWGDPWPLTQPLEREYWAQTLWAAEQHVKAGKPDEVIPRLTGLKVASFQAYSRDDLLKKAAELKAKAGKKR
jgi:hypothetical protein